MSTTIIQSNTLFDRFPTEIIFMIFNYLSNNDIIHTFFHLSQRLNYLLLHNKRYLNSLELPTRNFDFWEDVLLIIGSQIESLNIKTIDLSFPLTYFTNLKSLIISSPYGSDDDQLEIILKSDSFQKLNSFKIKQNKTRNWKIFGNRLDILEKHLIKRVFNHKNSLEIFEYPLQIPLYHLSEDNFETNIHLKSLTLVLRHFQDVSMVISFTPNLEYLNVQSDLLYTNQTMINKIDINLKEFHFTATGQSFRLTDFDTFFSYIKQFSSSLTCLSFNLVRLPMRKILFNSLTLQQFLESMIQLQQFHLYAKSLESDKENILLEFQNKFWFDHKWFFGMHGNYFYTLPFHFDYLYEFYEGFSGVKSTHPELLETNLRLWYNVKSIDLSMTWEYGLDLIKQLQTKMPKLTFIKFGENYSSEQNEVKDVLINKIQIEKSNIKIK